MRENDRHNGIQVSIYTYIVMRAQNFRLLFAGRMALSKTVFRRMPVLMVFKLVPKNLTPLHKITPSCAHGVRRIIHRNAPLCNRPPIILYIILYYYLYNMTTRIRGFSFVFRSQMTTAADGRSVFLRETCPERSTFVSQEKNVSVFIRNIC